MKEWFDEGSDNLFDNEYQNLLDGKNADGSIDLIKSEKIYSEDELKELIWSSQNLFLSKKYLNLVNRNRKNKFKKWFEQFKKK
jgi:hypothetical protein